MPYPGPARRPIRPIRPIRTVHDQPEESPMALLRALSAVLRRKRTKKKSDPSIYPMF